MLATAHPFSISNILDSSAASGDSVTTCSTRLTHPAPIGSAASSTLLSSPSTNIGILTSLIATRSDPPPPFQNYSPGNHTPPNLYPSNLSPTSSGSGAVMMTSSRCSMTSPFSRPHVSAGEGTRQNDLINTFAEELVKNFGSSLMKLGEMTDPLSFAGNSVKVTDQGSGLPWPILIASTLGKQGMIKTRKRRTTFSREQLISMERMFQKHPYLTPTQRSDLAKSLNLAQIQVQVWFQNRRAKCKKTGV